MSDNTMLTPYQKKPWPTRWYIWLRYMPLAYFTGIANVIVWVLTGARPLQWIDEETGEIERDSRRVTLEIIWSHAISIPEVAMGHYYTLEQCFGGCDEKDI